MYLVVSFDKRKFICVIYGQGLSYFSSNLTVMQVGFKKKSHQENNESPFMVYKEKRVLLTPNHLEGNVILLKVFLLLTLATP